MTADSDEYITELQKRLEEWNMGLDELQSRVDRAEARSEAGTRPKLEKLRRQLEEVGTKVRSTPPKEGDEWKQFREGMEEARDLLDEGIEEARRALDE